MTKPSKPFTPVKAWAGFCQDRLDYGWDPERRFEDGHYGIFRNRREASDKYQDVRHVLISPLPPAKRGTKTRKTSIDKATCDAECKKYLPPRKTSRPSKKPKFKK